MGYLHWVSLVGLAASVAVRAEAGEVPLYQPQPAWIETAPLPDADTLAGKPAHILFDMHQRLEDGLLWSYTDGATRIASPEMLSQFATIMAAWAPDKGDLIVHELSIHRGAERIDLLAKGQKFTVLRREESLEQRELTGILTATLAVEGLRVGDILRFRASTTAKDEALGGHVQSAAFIMAAPARIGSGRMRFSWPADETPKWKIRGEGIDAAPVRKGAYTQLELTPPAPKQPEMPQDAPPRFQLPPMIEISTFDDWGDVSKVMAPLYETEAAIAPGGAIAAEVAAIMKADATPLGRTQRALELVQDKIRYLAVGMDGGNYVPQAPAETWELRYGDCKAKTLLLLAMLHAMDIEAEPVLANIGLGDAVPGRVPSAMAFNHVLVRATVDGRTLWLDGTGSGSRLADIGDTPPLRHVLPVRAAGAELVEIVTRPNARPLIDVTIDADESASLDIPSVFDAKAVIRGAPAAGMTAAIEQLDEKQQRDLVGEFFQGYLGEAQFSTATIASNPTEGSVTLAARGLTGSAWRNEERQRKRPLSKMLANFGFTPDRGRPAWAAIPVATPPPLGMRFALRLRLPEGGRGYAVEGEPDFEGRVGGYEIKRKMRLERGVVTIEERMDSSGAEIAGADIAAERDKAAVAVARAPRIVAPENPRRSWEMAAKDPAGSTQIAAAEEIYAQAIAQEEETATGYRSRASFRSALGDRRGALADLSRAIEIEPAVDLYLWRAGVAYELGDLKAARADAEAARALDPSDQEAVRRVAWLTAEGGDLPAALALLDERIALGGDTRTFYREQKASLVGEFGDAAESVKLYDELLAEKPGSPSLLNGRCWIKGTRSVMLDTALKDCTQAIELSSDSTEALDQPRNGLVPHGAARRGAARSRGCARREAQQGREPVPARRRAEEPRSRRGS